MAKLCLFYDLRAVADPCAIRLWQHEVGIRLGLHGRVVVSPQGLHGTVGGDRQQLVEYVSETRRHPDFAELPFYDIEAVGPQRPRLEVSIEEQIVALGAADELGISHFGVLPRECRLTPAGVHELVARRGSDVVFFDGRNRYESAVGRFRGAVVPGVHTTRDFLRELDSGKLDGLKDRPVVAYSTVGLRSEVLVSLMAARGFSEVYLLEGGIASYGSDYADDGLWEGSLSLLGGAMQVVFSDHPRVVGSCESCGAGTSRYRDCVAPLCGNHALLCNGCADFPLCAACRN